MWFPGHKSSPNRPKTSKITQKTTLSTIVGDPTAFFCRQSTTLYSLNSPNSDIRAQKVFQDHTAAPRPQKWPNLATKHKNNPKDYTFYSSGGANSCYIGNQPLYIQCMILTKVFWTQEGIFRSQSGSLATKNGQKCFCTGNRLLYIHWMVLT